MLQYLLIDGVPYKDEPVGDSGKRLGMTDKEIPVVGQVPVKIREQPLLRFPVEINYDVAAEDDVELALHRKTRVEQIEPAELRRLFHYLMDTVLERPSERSADAEPPSAAAVVEQIELPWGEPGKPAPGTAP